MPHFSLALLVLFFEKAEQTVECLKSFEGSGVPIYLLDNGSSVGSGKVLDDYVRNHTKIRIVREPSNIGVGPGRNRLIAVAEEEWLFFIDNDIVIESRDWLERLGAHIHQHPDVEVFVPRLYNWQERQWATYSNFEIMDREMHRKPLTGAEMNNFPGGAAIVRRSLFARLGDYDEKIFVGGEDYEFSLRGLLLHRPVKGCQIDDIVLVHHHRAATDEASLAAANVRYDLERNAASMRHIEDKFGISVCSDWQVWIQRKLRLMTRGESFWTRIKRKLKRSLGKAPKFRQP